MTIAELNGALGDQKFVKYIPTHKLKRHQTYKRQRDALEMYSLFMLVPICL